MPVCWKLFECVVMVTRSGIFTTSTRPCVGQLNVGRRIDECHCERGLEGRESQHGSESMTGWVVFAVATALRILKLTVLYSKRFGRRPADLLDAVGIQKGAIKVFLRQTPFDCIERLRSQQVDVYATKIQSGVRGSLSRGQFHRLRASLIVSQTCARGFVARRATRVKHESATAIQGMYRIKVAHGELEARRESKRLLEAELS